MSAVPDGPNPNAQDYERQMYEQGYGRRFRDNAELINEGARGPR